LGSAYIRLSPVGAHRPDHFNGARLPSATSRMIDVFNLSNLVESEIRIIGVPFCAPMPGER
jgi:ADP-glucose pyrophosphorylase